MTSILVSVCPDEYQLTKVGSSIPQINKFLNQTYELSDEDYYECLNTLDQNTGVRWWSSLQELIQKEKGQINGGLKQRVNGIGSVKGNDSGSKIKNGPIRKNIQIKPNKSGRYSR